VVVLGNYDTNDVKFGQTAEVYKRLEQEVSVIVHVAWSVGFNKPVQAYADQMFNVAQFARLAAVPASRSPTQPKRVVFTSSVSVALAYPAASGGNYNVPEEELDIQAASGVAGYSRSKFAAETILMEAYRQLGVPTKIVRVGQIAGDREQGVWTNVTELCALLTYAPTTVRALPSSVFFSGVSKLVDWVPVDDVAKALLEFALDTPRTASVHNLVNPKSINWSEFINILRRALPTTTFAIQPYDEWVGTLSKDLESGESEEVIRKRNPFFELIPFLQQSVSQDSSKGKDDDDKALVFLTDAAQRDSSVIRSLPALDDVLVRRYLRGWQRAGLIDPEVEIEG
jgi:thioester reductase-like protein